MVGTETRKGGNTGTTKGATQKEKPYHLETEGNIVIQCCSFIDRWICFWPTICVKSHTQLSLTSSEFVSHLKPKMTDLFLKLVRKANLNGVACSAHARKALWQEEDATRVPGTSGWDAEERDKAAVSDSVLHKHIYFQASGPTHKDTMCNTRGSCLCVNFSLIFLITRFGKDWPYWSVFIAS